MTTYYVGKGGNDSNNGTTWALRKLTLNGAEDIPVAAGDTVIVGPGVYRELLTIDVSGTTDGDITYEGDIYGYRTDGIGGSIIITASDDDLSVASRGNISMNSAGDYRTFRNITLEYGNSTYMIYQNGRDYVTFEDVVFRGGAAGSLFQDTTNNTFRRCLIMDNAQLYFTVTTDNSNNLFENCIFTDGYAIRISVVPGMTFNNCSFMDCGTYGIYQSAALSAGKTPNKVRNSIFHRGGTNLRASSTDDIDEDYNSLTGGTARNGVDVGAHSDAYIMNPTPTDKGVDGFFGLGIYNVNYLLQPDSAMRYIASATDTTMPTDDFFGITRPVTNGKQSRGAVQYVPAEINTSTDYVRTGDSSLKMEDAGAVQFRFPVTSTDSMTAEVYVYSSSDYAGTKPQMIIKQVGQSDITVTDTGDPKAWNQLTQAFNPAALPRWGVIELRSNNTAPTTDAVAIYWDDLTIS